MVSQRLINYIKKDLKGHDKEEIRKMLVGHGYPEELADIAINTAVEANGQEKESEREGKKERRNIKKLEGEREQKKKQLKVEKKRKSKEKEIRKKEFKIKKEESKKKFERLKKKTVEKARKNSKVLILILIIIILGMGFFVFRSFSNIKLPSSDKKNFSVGLITNMTNLDDNSLKDMAYNVLLDSKEKYKIEFEILEPKNEEETKKEIRNFSEQKFDLIISVGFNSVEAVNDIATEFPDIKFVIINGIVDKPNVASIIFKEEEGSYLAGIMAGMMTKSNKIGFIGGVDTPMIKKFEVGFSAGVKSVNTDARVISKYLFSNDLAGFNSPEKGKENAIELYDVGVDIIYHAAGLSGNGVIEAAKEKDKYVIGVDFNQDYMAKGNVLTSVVKRVDNAISIIIDKSLNNNFEGKIYEFGVSEDCISLTEFEYTRDIIPEKVIERIEKAKTDIKAGDIKIPLNLD